MAIGNEFENVETNIAHQTWIQPGPDSAVSHLRLATEAVHCFVYLQHSVVPSVSRPPTERDKFYVKPTYSV
ncbi:hypothetical protein SAMN04487894_10214 [Niabella drilacis]|uniref:Uncharacterized protein n=1 Tax=Niabella drilacis (strain DSM 25811 / CCM 8410 / CCUG 62505 / LMG 26954 / E90) TaxID=1285928 RepID=A0A1G6KKG1_NIADE|nr:hypothetical protein SAMN04487894_10214 [Niabella drilacis]